MRRCPVTIRGGVDEAGREAFGDFDIAARSGSALGSDHPPWMRASLRVYG